MTDDLVRDHVEGYLAEDDVLRTARAAAGQRECTPVGPGAGAALRFLAATIAARAVVEVGTGTGVSGLWLLRGMTGDGVLTSIDVDPERQRDAKRAFLDSGYGPSRLRLINGMGLEVLTRLKDGGYDLVFVDAEPAQYPRYVDEAVRLLRAGGLLVLGDALADAEPVRDAVRQVREDERLVPVLLPVGAGLLAAVLAAG